MAVESAAPAVAVAADRRRYPGVRSFEERDQARFFGRGRATDDLLLRVLSVRLLLQFAPSGVGKTSLLNAGLFPRLREHHLFPVMVRLNQPAESLTQAVRRSLREAAQAAALPDPVIPTDGDRLWDLLGGVQLWSPDLLLLMPVLVFDQFEEVFTLRDEMFREEFGREIGALSLGRAPEPAADRDGPPAPAPDVKVILSLREEYLGKLEEFSARVPDLFHERLRLSPLTPEEAREAIVEPARLPGDEWLSPAFGFEAACLDELVDYVDGSVGSLRVIEPLTLQLVCQRAEVLASERARAGAPPPTLTIEDFGRLPGLENLVDHFYRGELQKLPAGATRTRTQQMIEHGLLDPTGKRLMLEEDQIKRLYGLDRRVLDQLAESRLLRREPRNGSVFYEISHDRLTEVITKKRARAPLPWWVALVLVSGVMVILSLIVAVAMALTTKKGIEKANQRVEHALSLLLNEDLVGRLREVGLTDALQHVLTEARIDETSASKARALSLRHQGDMALERSTITDAGGRFHSALDAIDALSPGGRGDDELLVERARVLDRLGSVAEDAGQVGDAARYREQSVQIWDTLLQSRRPAQQVIDASQALMDLGRMQWRMGDARSAQATHTRALRLALQVLASSIEHVYAAHDDYIYDQGHAMQVYADAAANLAAEEDESRAAYLLARESLRLRPLSASARGQVAFAAATYGSYLLYGTVSRTQEIAPSQLDHHHSDETVFAHPDRLLLDATRQFDDLIRWDYDNLRQRRESAAAHLLSPEGRAQCAETPACAATLDPRRLEDALGAALASLGQFRQLAALDPANHSLMRDVAWGRTVQGRLLYALGRHDEGLRCFDDALKFYRSAAGDPRDLQGHLDVPRALYQKAVLLSPEPPQALAALDAALAELARLPPDAAAVIQQRVITGTAKAGLLRSTGRTEEADRLDGDLKALAARIPKPPPAQHQIAEDRNSAGVKLRDAAAALSGADALPGLYRALEEFKAASTEYPFEFTYWDNLLTTYKIIRKNQDQPGDAAPPVAGGANGRGRIVAPSASDQAAEDTLRGALMAAWMARVLRTDPESTDTAGVARTADSWKSAYEARRDLIQFLRRHNRTDEANAQLNQALPEAEEYARLNPDSNAALALLADVNARLGQIRWEMEKDGWEEGLRGAIEYRERIATTDPDNADNRTRIGRMRRVLGDHLKTIGRTPDAVTEYTRALAACRAVRTTANDTERANLKSCFDELEAAGYR
jgi:tetratricopeptide (TPR) repeat protein